MRAPRRQRPLIRRPGTSPPPGTDLAALAERVHYVGSPEHKDAPTFAGQPAPRADASICDPEFASRLGEMNEWLKAALRDGRVGGPWEGDFPRYAWHREGDDVFEARLVNRGQGAYKGYRLRPEEHPSGL